MPVELKNLKCVKQTMDFPNRPLAELELLDHVHGCIILQPEGGTPFHNFGYWDANDACLGQWLGVFTEIQRLIDKGGSFTYEFQYRDQGDPKLEFVFSDDSVRIVTTCYTDDSWTEVEESWEQSTTRLEFATLVRDALLLIERTILEASPANGAAWIQRNRS
ncbi:hypothetical protein Spb1_13650 [Planctopirus ephydatiae]|uniref:Uncharacterized protein n=2 Tax=Planctopirus ephydatiae TaxID=2528019 RepID=A0A518GLL6_9PLAN|nr:hypothetical protein Spb1_13650 [Planctopirus ephydatiae]